MRVKNLMTTNLHCCTPKDTVQAAARMMKEHGVGALPVVSDASSRRLEGIVTDRDLCCAIVAEGKAAGAVRVQDVMTATPVTCSPEDTLDGCEQLMQEHRIRRIPVIDEERRCVGIVAQADVVLHETAAKLRRTMAEISRPRSTREPTRGAVA
jgi:CBS domain-containing protein